MLNYSIINIIYLNKHKINETNEMCLFYSHLSHLLWRLFLVVACNQMNLKVNGT